MLFLHGSGDTARAFARTWQPLVDQGWTLVVPQSSRPHHGGGFTWDDTDAALAEVRNHLEDCRTRWRLPVEGIVLAGASEGAAAAMQAAAETGLPWLAVTPVFPRVFDVTRLAAVPRHTRGGVILGEHDPANTRSRQLIAELHGAGVPVEVRTVKGIGHEMSDDSVRQAGDLLRELAAAQAGGEPLSEAW